MRQAIATILGTTILAWGLAATSVYAETTVDARGPRENLESRIEYSTVRAEPGAEQPQQIGCSDNTGLGAGATKRTATVPASDQLLALLHRLNRVDGSPMAPFRLD